MKSHRRLRVRPESGILALANPWVHPGKRVGSLNFPVAYGEIHPRNGEFRWAGDEPPTGAGTTWLSLGRSSQVEDSQAIPAFCRRLGNE